MNQILTVIFYRTTQGHEPVRECSNPFLHKGYQDDIGSCFYQKTNKTPPKDLELARKRKQELLSYDV